MNTETASKIPLGTTTTNHVLTSRPTFVLVSTTLWNIAVKTEETQKSATLSAIADKDVENSEIHNPTTRAATFAAIADKDPENLSRNRNRQNTSFPATADKMCFGLEKTLCSRIKIARASLWWKDKILILPFITPEAESFEFAGTLR